MEDMKNSHVILEGYADPDVLYYKGTYYLYATSYHISDGYEVYTSTDLKNWTNHGSCLGGSFGLDRWFWAPDVKEHNGRFYMLASIDEHLGLLIADSPLGPFMPQDTFLLDHTIDGHILFENDQMYLYYVSWREGHPYGIWGCKMQADCRTPDFSTEKLLLIADMPYECNQSSPVAEAPYVLVHDGKYYMTYSGSGFLSPYYCIAYAVSEHPLGPYVKYAANPILVGDGDHVSGIGHHAITAAPDGGLALIYHTHRAPGQVHPRDLRLGSIRFEKENGEWILRAEE